MEKYRGEGYQHERKEQKKNMTDEIIEAMRTGNYYILIKLLRRDDIDFNARGSDGVTPLIETLTTNRMHDFITLVNKPEVDLDAPDSDGHTPLWHAMKLNNLYAQARLTRKR